MEGPLLMTLTEFHPTEGHNGEIRSMGENTTAAMPAVTFNNSFEPGHEEIAVDGVEMPPQRRKSSRDYSHTDEWGE